MPEPHSIRWRRLTWTAIATAAIIRAILVLQPACIDRNGVQFIEFSRRLAADPIHAMQVTTRQPGFSSLLLWTHRAVGPLVGGDSPEAWQRCGELLALAGGIATCIGVVLLTRRLFDDRTAFAAGVLAAIWPQGGHLSAGVLSDMPHLALFLFAMLQLITAIATRSLIRCAATGALVGLAYLIKQEAAALFLASILCWLLAARAGPAKARWLGLAALILAFVAIVSPHSIATGKLLPNKNPLDLFRALSAGDVSPNHLLAYVVPWWQTPARFFEEWLRSGRYVIAILFLIAIVSPRAAKAESNGRRLVAWCAVIYIALVQARSVIYGEISERYAAIPAALAIPWAAAGWIVLFQTAAGVSQGSARRVLLLLVALVVPIPAAIYVARPVYGGKDHYRKAGIELRSLAASGERILAHEHLEQVLFYAGRVYPDNTWIKCRREDTGSRLLRIVRGQKPDWYVDAAGSHRGKLDENEHFRWLASQSTRFEPVQSFGPDEKRVLLYRVRPAPGKGATFIER